MGWGQRDCAFRDPSGNMVRIAQAPDGRDPRRRSGDHVATSGSIGCGTGAGSRYEDARRADAGGLCETGDVACARRAAPAWIMMCAQASASAVGSWCGKSMNPAGRRDRRQAIRLEIVELARDLQAARRSGRAGRRRRSPRTRAAAPSCRSRRCARPARPLPRRRRDRRAARSTSSRRSTSSARRPWMRVFSSKNRSWPGGGWMSHPAVATTRPSRTRASPTAQADALLEFAVSKSIAVKSRGTTPESPRAGVRAEARRDGRAAVQPPSYRASAG